MLRLGLQIPSFTYPGVPPADLFERVAAIAVTAEQSGFDTVMVMDHFYQLPMLGPPEHEMFEAYTLLAALAARTTTAKLGTLVTGVTYRNPAYLAKQVTAVDVISKGRAFLGIGAAWYAEEHHALGYDFPPVARRFEQLEEALQICRAMFRSERPTIEGKHFAVRDAINSPAPVTPGGPPIMVGGNGERKTLRLAARYADLWNSTAPFAELPRKLEVLAGHCADAGRDIASINKTPLGSLVLADTMEQAQAKRRAALVARGLDPDRMSDAQRAIVDGRMVVGDPDSAGEQVTALLALGLDGVVFNMPADAWDLEAVARAGEVLSKVVPG